MPTHSPTSAAPTSVVPTIEAPTSAAPTNKPTPVPTPIPINLPADAPTVDPTVYPSMKQPDDCVFWEVGPVDISHNNKIGSVLLHNVVNVTLELKIATVNWTCPVDEFCNVFGIGKENTSHPKLPSLTLRENNSDNMKILVVASENSTEKQQVQFGNSGFRQSFNDGMLR